MACSKESGVPPYAIMNNRTMALLASSRPTSRTDLSQVRGFGEKTLKKYGNDILSVVESAEVSNEP
ncbi:MAG: HRDC domain-containing protein [Oligoflexales bacterium]